MRLLLSLILICVFAIYAEVTAQSDYKIIDPPFPQGGYDSLYKFIADSLHYPKYALEHKIEGKVKVIFVVDTLGYIPYDSIKIYESPHDSLNQEAIRLVSIAQKWEPGFDDKGLKSYRIVLPIIFRLPEEPKSRRKERKGRHEKSPDN